MHYILFYEYASDYLERRGEYRDQHMALAKASIDRGELFLGGSWCVRCWKKTAIVDFHGQMERGGLLLEGRCLSCDGPVTRLVEGG